MTKDKEGFGGQKLRVPQVAGENPVEEAQPQKRRARRRSRKPSQSSASHPTRSQQARGAEELHPRSEGDWTPPSSLAAPPPRPGYRQKWMRVAIYGRDDVQNVARKYREGWLPREPSTVPKSFSVPTLKSGQFAGCIGVEGSVLVEMPAARVEQRNAHYRKKAEAMAQDIERNIEKVNRAVPLHVGFGRITKVETSKRVRPAPVDSSEEMEA